MKWFGTRTASAGGRFMLYLTKRTAGGKATNVTVVRGAPTQIDNYSSGDPFGDSTAQFTFPSITIFDDLTAPDLFPWLAYYSDVDLYWLPLQPNDDGRYAGHNWPVINPITGLDDYVAPAYLYHADGSKGASQMVKLWEGFVADFGFSDDKLQIQCQGALFQVDRYLQKPFYPARPWPLEQLIRDVFSHNRKPHLRTKPLSIVFPAGWTKKVPKYVGESANVYSPVAQPGSLWTGLASRDTGAWEHALTGFVQDTLADMIVDGASGVTPGNQWTVVHGRATPTNPAGRQPVLQVRDRYAGPSFSVWVGQPGVSCDISGDSTQSENLVYGNGTDINGETWRNAVISDDGSRTDYLPLAAARQVYPARNNPAFAKSAFASEAYVNFGSGFAQTDAQTVSEQQLARDQEPGWSGTITLSIDPNQGLPRWLIRAGMTVLVKGFLGTGATGVSFHIASVEVNPAAGTVALTVDTRFRDLLTVAEAQSRTRDPLNPVRMLQVNKDSAMVEDVQAPWDYQAGSGFIPKASTTFYAHKPNSDVYPYDDWVAKHPPLHYPHWYVKVNAAARTRRGRWTGPVPILTSEKGSIARSEFFCVDVYGNRKKVPFHVSIWQFDVTVSAMPFDGSGPSPYINNAFESINPATGQQWGPDVYLAPANGFIIGWGNRSNGIYNRAGFSPGSEAEGNSPTGLLVDDTVWPFDNTNNQNYQRQAKPGQKQDRSAITLYAMFYCESNEPVYFGGRLYRQNPGVS